MDKEACEESKFGILVESTEPSLMLLSSVGPLSLLGEHAYPKTTVVNIIAIKLARIFFMIDQLNVETTIKKIIPEENSKKKQVVNGKSCVSSLLIMLDCF